MKKETNSALILCGFDRRIQELQAEIAKIMGNGAIKNGAEGLDELESTLQGLNGELIDLLAAKKLQEALDSEFTGDQVLKIIQALPCKFKNFGMRLTPVRMSNGTTVYVLTPYFARPCLEKNPAKRGIGFYPSLLVLGIFDKCSPRLASEVSMTAAALASIKEAQNMLAARGCELDFKTIRNIVKRFAARARACQERGDIPEESLDIVGCRVVISIDGGRIRIRKNKKGQKTKNGRRRYHTDWREPKLFIIYVINDDGRQKKTFSPVIDASLNGPENIIALLGFYLRKMDICKASSVSVVADGARWIWERATALLAALGLKVEQIHFVLDFYHAVEHLSNLLDLLKWPAADRKSYLTKYRRILLNGKTNAFFDFVDSISKRSRSKEIIRERKYFAKNKTKMQYYRFAAMKLPLGSGAVESAIRRVINLRLKGPGIFWLEDTANEMLMLRCYYKANRWGMLNKMASSLARTEVV
jgi:hypothetical protein